MNILYEYDLCIMCSQASHAACAYSVAAPGAAVLAVQPRATLDPRRAGWDLRHTGVRRSDFTSRYGYAPDMVEAARAVWLMLDPFEPLDAMHGALFHGPNIHILRTPWLGGQIAAVLDHIRARVISGEVTERGLARLAGLQEKLGRPDVARELPSRVNCMTSLGSRSRRFVVSQSR